MLFAAVVRPANSNFSYAQLKNKTNEYIIEVFNLPGQKINASVSGVMLDVASLVPGIYLVLIEKDGQRYSGELIVAE